MSRDARAVIDLAALRHNYEVARRAAQGSRIFAVAKANGYGHGLVQVARALRERADGYAVACLEEAAVLREAGIEQPILLLEGFFDAAELREIERYRLQIVVHARWQIEILERARLERPLRVWLKVDSGMHRLGLPVAEVRRAYGRLAGLPAVGGIGFLTHLACADDRRCDYTDFQLAEFERACDGLPGERSIANSAGLLAWPRARGGWVRPGIMLYGASPFADGLPERPELKAVMTLGTQLIAVQHYRRGDRVGYSGAFVCPEDMPVGVIAMGYGDGYPRHAPTGTPVLIGGRRSQVIGRVSMDMLCVDLRGFEAAGVGERVTLWGEGLPVEEVAEACGTISYELLCKLTSRVRFEYRDG